jgi:sterol desaturase/sphingolipid hydroxylase (fatty acid hydroxylase superfamily)
VEPKWLEMATLALVPAFLLLDVIVSARPLHRPRHWRARGIVVTLVMIVWSTWFALTLGGVLGEATLFDLSGLGAWGAIVGVLVYELGHYAYHRAAHRWSWLWRAGHQMHHSAERIDAFGAYWLHPLDAAAFTAIQVLVFFPLLGLAPVAGALGALFLTFNGMFQHANLRTPRWLGYVIQRPESHGLHHARGVHGYNYADLPLWDIVFGTFRNPTEPPAEAGFYDGASLRIGAMLLGRDVSRPAAARSRPIEGPATDDPGVASA